MAFPTQQRARKHVEKYWDSITYHITENDGITMALPHPFVAPCHTHTFSKQQFYWDSYFTILGLVVCDRVELAQGMIDNLTHLFRMYGIIPMRNRLYNLGGSQPPFLTQMIREVAARIDDPEWESQAMHIAEQELSTYWKSEDIPEHHLAHNGLSRYCDHYVTHATSEHESGWDMTSRFQERCRDFLPIDLNSLLYVYETDLADYFSRQGEEEKAEEYRAQATQRKKTMHELMWDEKTAFFHDYDYVHQARSDFLSLAGFYPLWAGLATQEQADKVVEQLYAFEHAGGLAMTQDHGLTSEFRQWDYPNGWPNQHWIVIKGLQRYGHTEAAARITNKWLSLIEEVFEQTGAFWEKYDVVSRGIGVSGRYPTQEGFGWTNAVYARLLHESNATDKK